MIQIADMEEAKALLQSQKNKHQPILRNRLFMLTELENYIAEGRLYADEYEEGLIFLIDEGTYYNCLLTWRKDTPLPDKMRMSVDKPLLMEEIFVEGRITAEQEQVEKLLLAAGFVPEKENYQFWMDIAQYGEELNAWESAYVPPSDCSLCYVTDSVHYEQAVHLWDSCLDPTDIPLQHRKQTADNKLLCFVDSKGDVVATQLCILQGKNSEGRHTATRPEYRRRGLAEALLKQWCLDMARQNISRCQTWIASDNQKSIFLHEKVGFCKNGRISRQYILK